MNPRMQKVDRYDSVWSAFRKVNANFDELLSAMRARSTNDMTLRQYAAIKLRVPDSGTEWLDDMIRRAQRDELAAKAMAGLMGGSWRPPGVGEVADAEDFARAAYLLADAMLAAREGKS